MISFIAIVLLLAIVGAVFLPRTVAREPSGTYSEESVSSLEEGAFANDGASREQPKLPESPGSEPEESDPADRSAGSDISTGPVTDDLILLALRRWRPVFDDPVAPRFFDRPVRLLRRDDTAEIGRSDRFLLDILNGAADERIEESILPRSRDAVERRLAVLRDIPMEPTGIYAFLDTTVAGVRQYLLLLPEDPLLVTIYETTGGIEDIEVSRFEEPIQP